MHRRHPLWKGISTMKLLFVLLIFPLVNGDKIVQTTNGPVRGISLSPKNVEAFLGIPYAEPPVGSLRFSKPVPKKSWENTYNADKLPPACIQLNSNTDLAFTADDNREMSEDCLFLNLWVPEGGKDLKPIMLFIYGGGFMIGTSNSKVYNGANLSEHGDVIVASMNYRLGSLGLFYGFTEDAAGNMALYDQAMAMQWIKDNAKNFGGDPDNIVLFGESAGGFSISVHLASPLSKNLFNRAILQSGTAFSAIFRESNGSTIRNQMFANQLGCLAEQESLRENAKKAVDCLRALPSKAFSKADEIISKNHGSFLPRIGEAFIPESTTDTFRKGNYKDAELLIGVNRDEGSVLLTGILADLLGGRGEKSATVDFDETNARQFLKKLAELVNGAIDENLIQKYFDRVKKEQNYTYLKATAEIVGDLGVTCGAVFQADFHYLKSKPAYFYLFDYRPDSSPLAEWMGVSHFDEVQYVFGNPIYEKFTEREIAVSKNIMDTWIAFAKTGNPSTVGMKWPQYTYKDPKYVIISNENKVGTSPDDKRCELWREIFDASIEAKTCF